MSRHKTLEQVRTRAKSVNWETSSSSKLLSTQLLLNARSAFSRLGHMRALRSFRQLRQASAKIFMYVENTCNSDKNDMRQ